MPRLSGSITGCYGKKQYHSYYAAYRGSKRMNRSVDATGNPYRCDYCNQWHVGNTMHGKRKHNRHAKGPTYGS